MRISRFFLPGLLALASCISNPAGKELTGYSPEYEETWPEVMHFIDSMWDSAIAVSPKLPKPYVTIIYGANILFYWDSYFTNLGLLNNPGKRYLAKNACDNLLYQVEQFGFAPNSDKAWGLNRSQPPYLCMMVYDYYTTSEIKDKEWLRSAYNTLKKEYHFWTDSSSIAIEDNTTTVKGLQRYSHHASIEEQIIFYSNLYKRGVVIIHPDSISKEEQVRIISPYVAEAESGMDFTPRFENRCPDFIAVDLNSNLYLYETYFAFFVKELNLEDQPDWVQLASERKKLIHQYCWSEERGLFLDYDFKNHRHSSVASATCFSPLYANLATKEQADRTVKNIHLFEFGYGISACEKSEQELSYQWDYPACWPPLQYLAVAGLNNYGYTPEAKRIAAKFLDNAAKNYLTPFPQKCGKTSREPGWIYEKYDIHGNIGDSEYCARAMQGWTAGVLVSLYEFINGSKN